MRALRVNQERGLFLDEVAHPAPDTDALVRVLRSGICNTDLEIVRGYAGFSGTIGHEFVGIVEKSFDRPEMIGKRVVGEINASCGHCPHCANRDPRHCPNRTVLGIVGRDGCHAEYLTLPSRNLFEVPDAVSDEQAVFVEPLAAAYGITEQVEIGPETSVAVIGDGKLGLLCAMAMRLRAGKVTLLGRHRSKMSIAEDKGVEVMTAGEAGDLSGSFDVVIEASGSESGFESAVNLVRPRGKIVLKSTFHGSPTWPAARIVVDEITVVGSRCGRFEPALDLLANSEIDVSPLISDEFSLADGIEAFERAAQKGVLKVLLRMEG